MALQPIVIVFS